jgi:hypothetical protein
MWYTSRGPRMTPESYERKIRQQHRRGSQDREELFRKHHIRFSNNA